MDLQLRKVYICNSYTMQRYERSIEIQVPVEELFAFHTEPSNLPRITPPNVRVEVLRHDPPGEDAIVELRVRPILLLPFISTRLRMRFDIFDPPRRLADVQVAGPFRSWRQIREFIPIDESHSLLHDTVLYELPLGPLGRLVNNLFVARQVRRMFEHRQMTTKELLEVNRSPG